ncbi:hypothetical protein C8J57DRAFT_1458569 [Mycena rebaudengoi]|nr:hypothetical protein C8J57DRAFT_1458569 [Mycena rebaudengoi]
MDKNHLTLYHCPRGTNSVEGAVHNPLRRNFAALNASPELADSLAADWRHRHNVDCGALHKNNLKYSGHYDPWIDDDIFRLRADIEWNDSLLILPQRVIQDTSPLSFAPTHVQFGITGIPLTLRAKNDFLGPGHDTIEVEVASVYPERLHLSTLKAKRDNIYAYLAHAQKTKFAVTPVHTQDEFDLYHTAMTPGGDFFSLQGKVNFDRMATWWSTQADGKKIFYKLKEDLESHHKVWEGLRRSQDSLLSSREQRRPNRSRIRATTHVSHVLPAAARDNPGVIPDEDLISESMPDQLPPVDTNLSGSQGADDGSTQMQIPMEVDFLDIVSHPSDPLPDTNYRGSTPMSYNTQPWHGIEFQPTYWPQQAGLTSGSSQMNFVSYTGPPNLGKKRQRKCQNCVAAGQSGYNCPGESGRKRCKLLPNFFSSTYDTRASTLMTTPQPTPPPGPPGTRVSPDWLANLILTAKTITAAAECLPFPYIQGALSPVIPILEAVQKMTKNRDDFEELCENIVSTVKILQEKISHHGVDGTSSLLQLCWDLECKSTSIGDELARYKTRLEKLRSDFIDIGRQHACLLHGLGGAGKTQICLKFLDETAKSRFTDVFFLDASTVDTIKAGLKNIALTRSIGSDDEDASHWLASSQKEWLLIFDNADDPSIKLFNYFPQSSSGNILITSRNPQLYVHAPNCYHHISDMEEEDAVQLLLASAIQPLTIETQFLATDIVKALYCFPLAIVQAGAYIAKTQKLRKYLTVYEENHAELLSRLPDQPLDKYACFKCLGQLAAKFLQICSFLHHEGISEAIFSSAAIYKHGPLGPTEEQMREPHEFLNNFLTQTGTWDGLHFTDMTMEIQGYSLINEDPNTNLLSIHPLVHDWSRKTITDTNSTQQCTEIILAMATMSTWDKQVFHISLLPHLNSVLHGEAKIAHEFCYTYARVYYDSGHFNQSKELCVALLENREHILGSEHPDTLSVMSSLAATSWKLGKFTDSLELQVTVLQKWTQMLGPEHPNTLAAMSNLAITYYALGKLAEAEELDIAVLQKRKQIFGPGQKLWLPWKLTDAEELKVVVLEKRKQILGPDHPETLAAMSNLAATYHSLGKLTEAEELQVVVLEMMKQVLGPEHPDTLDTMSRLADMYHDLGKLTEAKGLKVVVLEKSKQVLGPDHPNTLQAMSNLAATYHSLGKFTEAEEIKVAVLGKRKQILGTEHLATLAAMSNLAATYHSLGKLTEAEELNVAVLEMSKKILGPDHPNTLAAMPNLAATYYSLGKLTEAEELKVVLLEKRKQMMGPEHPDTLTAMSSLADMYHDLGKLTEAEELKVVVLEKRKKILGPEDPDTLHAMSELAVTYHDLGKLREAEELKMVVLEKRKQILGPDHPKTLGAMSNLAATYWKLGKFMDAKELEVAVLEKRK